MNVLLWVLQAALAFLYFAGGYFKAFKFDELASQFTALSRGGWRTLGVLEMLGAVLLIVPAAMKWMPVMTLVAAAMLALESLALAAVFARHSLTDRAEPAGLECRDGSAGGFRGLWAIRAQAADLNNRISRKRT